MTSPTGIRVGADVVRKVTCIGAGTVGLSWAIAFARAGAEVAVYDPRADAVELGLKAFATVEPHYLERIKAAPDLAQALAGTRYVQESIPEDIHLKRAMFEAISDAAPSDACFGSSTSTLPGSSFLCGLPMSGRAMVVHPTNPPHVVPLTELSRTVETRSESFDWVWQLMSSCGQTPVEILREVLGFALNRLQAALLAEALTLVGEGVISPTDLDLVVSRGLGLRWALMGPFETGHLNAAGGYVDYMTKFRLSWESLFSAIGRPRQVDDVLIARIDKALRGNIGDDVTERQLRRDRLLWQIRSMLEREASAD